jgi:two-component system response regulator CpxR
MRQANIHTPILMLTAKGDDLDRILGLELGADDYVPKPCNPRELLARINAILRRSQVANNPDDGHLIIDARRLEASYKESTLKLTGAEFKTLESLHQRQGNIVTKEVLCEEALGRRLTRYDRSIDVHVSNLRKKLIEAGASSDIIINQRGSGYLLKPE